jgi:tight adherence protein B
MRGLAVLCAAGAGWSIVAGVPTPRARVALRLDATAVIVSAAVFVATAGVMIALLDVTAAALAIALIAAAVPIALDESRRRTREAQHRDRWPDVLMHIRGSVAAGATLEDSVISSFVAAGGRWADMAEAVRREVAFGAGFRSAIEDLRADQDDPTSDRVLVALSSASHAGGSRVGEAISVLARSVGDELRMRKAHDAAMTEQRLTIDVALFAPWVLLTLTIATNPQARDAFSQPDGAVVIAVGFLATALGWLFARRTARLRRQPRVFR